MSLAHSSNGRPWTGVTNQAVLDAIAYAGSSGISVKDIGRMIGSDMTAERNLKAVSNACGYLMRHDLVHRVDKGIYQVGPDPQKGKTMTMTEMNPPGIAGQPVEAARAQLAAAPAAAPIICDQCGKECASEMGLKAHITRSHPRGLTPDEAFERTGQALDVLFPNGIPTSRLIELADLQKQMLRAIK